MGREAEIWAERIPHMCESIGHRLFGAAAQKDALFEPNAILFLFETLSNRYHRLKVFVDASPR